MSDFNIHYSDIYKYNPAPRDTAITVVNYYTTTVVEITNLLAGNILSVVNVSGSYPALRMPSNTQLLSLFSDPQVGSVLEYTVEKDNTVALTLNYDDGYVEVYSSLAKLFISIISLNPLVMSIQTLNINSSLVFGPTGPTGPQGTDGLSYGQDLFLNVPTSTVSPAVGTLDTTLSLVGTTVVASNIPSQMGYLIASYLTEMGSLNYTDIQAGIWTLFLYASASSVTDVMIYYNIYFVANDGSDKTLIASDLLFV